MDFLPQFLSLVDNLRKSEQKEIPFNRISAFTKHFFLTYRI